MGPKLKTTTAVLACLNLAMPYPALAQSAESQAIQDAVEACREPNSDACLDATDRALQAQEGDAAQAGEEAPDAAAEGEPVTAPETADSPETSDAPTEAVTPETAEEEMPEAAEAPTEAPAEAAPEEAAAPETADEEMPEAVEVPAEEAAPAAPEETAAPETTGGTPAPEAPDATGPESVESAPDVPAPTEAPAETPDAEARTGADTEADAPAEAATGAEDTATGAAPEESAAEVPEGTGAAPASEMTDDADAAPAQGSDTAASPEPATDSAPEAAEEADEDTAATPSPGAPAAEDDTAGTDDATLDDAMRDAMGETETDETEQADTAAPAAPQSDADADAATPAADQAEADPAQGDPEDEANPEEQARSGAAPAAAAATAQDAEPEDVVSRTVTEADARSSSEDFDTAIEDDATAQAGAESDDDGGGMSTLEKALLLGAGALAVGTLVRGNREVVAASEDRVVVTDSSGAYQLIKDDNALLARPGTEVQTQTFDDGSTRTTVLREDGSQIVTIRDASLRVLRRERVTPDGQRILLIDDTQDVQPVELANLQPAQTQASVTGTSDEEALRQALAAEGGFDRAYSLSQIRNIAEVRYQVPAIDLDSITFESGSAAIDPEQAEQLTALGRLIRERIASDPTEIFLVEGHTDATGDAAYNLALSDRRAESVALALSEYFEVPPENLVVQGYGERFLKVETEAAERGNRRATVRRITQLLQVAAAQ